MKLGQFLVNLEARVRPNRPGPLSCLLIDFCSDQIFAIQQISTRSIRTHSIPLVPSAVAMHRAYPCFRLLDARGQEAT
jgi:hypothetical protein